MTDIMTLSTSKNVAQVFRKVAMKVILIGTFTNDENAHAFAELWKDDNGGEMPIISKIGQALPEQFVYEPTHYECV